MVNKAGEILIGGPTTEQVLEQAYTIINNWRLAHHFPLNTFQIGLRRKSKRVFADALVAQRIKRISSIDQKLRDNPNMKLSQMQDIGGCRAVVGDVSEVDKLVKLYKESDLKHHLVDEDDYIRDPKKSGYRSYHLIYKYYSDRKDTFNNLRIEMQIRSKLQHIWATAVEVVGTFTKQALKSSKGKEEWLRLFSLMGSEVAFREKTTLVPNTPTKRRELRDELRVHCAALQFEQRLRAYQLAFSVQETVDPGQAHYFLLSLNLEDRNVTYWRFKKNQLQEANALYLEKEKETASGHADVVLVSVDSFSALKRAYPNYFLDTEAFFALVNETIKR